MLTIMHKISAVQQLRHWLAKLFTSSLSIPTRKNREAYRL